MKYMVMHKADARSEREEPPTPELIAAVGGLVQGAIAEGRLVDGAGLRSSARRARITFAAGDPAVQRGPYAGGERELVAAVTKLKVADMDEALAWATRLARARGDAEVEVGTITEPWDLGVAPRPTGAVPLNAMVVHKASAASEAGEAAGAVEAVVAEAKAAGVFVGAHALAPTRGGARITGPKGARAVTDGPFAESKELLGGYMVMEFASREDAIAFALRYADIVGAAEVDVRAAL